MNSQGATAMTNDEALMVLDRLLGRERLNHLQEAVFRLSWEGQTYKEIAEAEGYDTDYVKVVGSQLWQTLSEHLGQPVTKNNFRVALRQWSTEQQEVSLPVPVPVFPIPSQDWGETIDVSQFCGRLAELTELTQWITQDKCRFVSILGMGGIGKTTLSVKLAEQVQGQFEFLIWRSLRNAPPTGCHSV